MAGGLFRLVELVFTAYVTPALLVPFVWLAGWARSRWRGGLSGRGAPLGRMLNWYFAGVVAWLVVWGVILLGLPAEQGGIAAAALCWLGYGTANLLFAQLLVRFTKEYGSLPPGEATDRLFARLLGAIVAQPVMTAVAFSVLYRITGVTWNLHVPGLPAVQEGI